MSGYELEAAETVLTGEIIEDEEYIKLVHNNLGIKEALASYLEFQDLAEESVDILLAHFSVAIAETANRNGELDINVIRTAFEHLVHSMNEVASHRHGYQPQSLGQSALTKFGFKKPQPKSYVKQLDDRYWSKQFLDQYENGGQPMAPKKDDETEEQYLARYIHTCMHGLLFAPFAYLK